MVQKSGSFEIHGIRDTIEAIIAADNEAKQEVGYEVKL